VLAARSGSIAAHCRGARLACSLRLDGEPTLRGRERLARHLRCCGSCYSFARDLDAISKLLRAGQQKEVPHFTP
jgi:predicted anti-sigma-YlaC factor YlaD